MSFTSSVPQYRVVEVFSLIDLDITDISDTLSFVVHIPSQVALILEPEAQHQKDLWMQDLYETILRMIQDGVRKKVFHFQQKTDEKFKRDSSLPAQMINSQLKRPEWIRDEDVTHCMQCSNSFSLLNRKHHCRACGKVVCYNCSLQKLMLLQLGYNQLERVCDTCFRENSARK